MSPANPFISVVIPAFNEMDALKDTVARVQEVLADYAFEIIIVDDGSSDRTWGVISELNAANPKVRGLGFARNFGHQPALLAGLEASRGDAVVTMDADGQHPPELIPELLEAWRNGAPVVQTIRSDAGVGFFKRATSNAYYKLFSWLAETKIEPGSADFRVLDRTVVDVLRQHPRSSLFLRGFIPWTGFATTHVPFEPLERTAGSTKYSLGRMFGLARQGIMRFSIKPLRLATFLGSATCIVALAYLVYVLIIRLTSTEFVIGWASLAGLLTLLGGIQLVVIGILGEYIGMIFETQLGRPPYVVQKRIGDEKEQS